MFVALLLFAPGLIRSPDLSRTQIEPLSFRGLQWRMIGPYRGGRTVAAGGIPALPNVFYIGATNGGVWKTDDAGRTWKPIFDGQPTGSIGALAIAPSDYNTIYVGSGEGLQRPDLSTGDGMYRSNDGGKTWEHLGLRNGQQIGAIIVDPRDANRLFVAVLGHPYGPNEERGVYRSIDGGRIFDKVLYNGPDTGAVALAFDPRDANVVYADLWAGRQGPWENGQWEGKGSGLYKSTDGGTNWRQLTKGLPDSATAIGRIGFGISPSEPQRIYATIDSRVGAGIYRSDDAGESWKVINKESRLFGRGGDFAEIKVDPRDPDTVYIANTSTYKSVDAGKKFRSWKGAPGGDDYHTVWINPIDQSIILLASDQGATITVNGGTTWSSWYNQPTAQFYHVATDNQFPYWVYGCQQESGSAMVSSRGNDGQITFREWHPVGAEEYGYVAPDPLNPNLVYGGKLSRYDKVTGGVENVMPEQARDRTKVRFVRTAPLVFSTVDPHVLLFAGNFLFRTTDGAKTWQTISPDLSREHPSIPSSVGIYRSDELAKMPRRGVIYTIAPSYLDENVIFVGTDDGLIHRTADGGKNWTNVTPPTVTAWQKISIIDAGHFDKNTAYAAVNAIRTDDMHPHIFRTHDNGATWQEITNGLPEDPVNVVREDPVRKGLLYCGTERGVYFSLDDGDHWNSLRQNMPATSIRDLVIHGNDLVIGTHGRSFWILDDVAPLRQIADGNAETLFAPSPAYLLERDTNSDTPLPPEEPAGQNPPDGAIIYYALPRAATKISLEVFDPAGKLFRRLSSEDKGAPVDEESLTVPSYWIRPFRPLPAGRGMNRYVWDMRGVVPATGRRGYPISAIYHDTPAQPQGPLASPGKYRIELTVDGRKYTQNLELKADPRGAGKPAPNSVTEDKD